MFIVERKFDDERLLPVVRPEKKVNLTRGIVQ